MKARGGGGGFARRDSTGSGHEVSHMVTDRATAIA
jgi:hypothetical protein